MISEARGRGSGTCAVPFCESSEAFSLSADKGIRRGHRVSTGILLGRTELPWGGMTADSVSLGKVDAAVTVVRPIRVVLLLSVVLTSVRAYGFI